MMDRIGKALFRFAGAAELSARQLVAIRQELEGIRCELALIRRCLRNETEIGEED